MLFCEFTRLQYRLVLHGYQNEEETTTILANCTDGDLRLVDGSTDREGRVEVCVGDRRWRTVCIGSQELAGAVCSQLGYIFEGIYKWMCIAYNLYTYRKLVDITQIISTWGIPRVQTGLYTTKQWNMAL